MTVNIQDEIMEEYYVFMGREGKVPNELHIPARRRDEFEQAIQKSLAYGHWKPDPLGKVKHWWYMGMRVFNEIWSFGVSWSKATEKIKQAQKERLSEDI